MGERGGGGTNKPSDLSWVNACRENCVADIGYRKRMAAEFGDKTAVR